MTPSVVPQRYEIISRFWVTAPNQEEAEKAVTALFEKFKAELKKDFTYEIQVEGVDA